MWDEWCGVFFIRVDNIGFFLTKKRAKLKEKERRENMSEIVQYFVVNQDLIKNYGMDAGKISAQVAHAATILTHSLTLVHDENFLSWLAHSQTKIVLKAKEKELLKLVEVGFLGIRDQGRTQIPPNSLTVVGLPPMEKDKAKEFVGRFRLL